MNETQSFGHPGRERIHSPGLFALILVGSFAILHHACAIPANEKIAAFEHKVDSRGRDLIQLSESLSARDQQLTWDISHVALEYVGKLQHIQDLLLIDSVVENEADKRRIEPIIRDRVKGLADTVDAAVKLINTDMAAVHNQAVIATAGKLKDDLRELKELLLK
jgi:hypothetical protein